jgi:hypothetical protein
VHICMDGAIKTRHWVGTKESFGTYSIPVFRIFIRKNDTAYSFFAMVDNIH